MSRFTFLYLLLIGSSFSSKAESIRSNYYEVVSDVFDASIKPGTCAVFGKVFDLNQQYVSVGVISNFDRSHFSSPDKDGSYELMLNGKDTSIFFYHEEYGEVVIWSYPFKSQHRVQVNFYVMKQSEIPVVVEKPVIYLYGKAGTNVALSLQTPDLGFTYPLYQNGWAIELGEEGELIDERTGRSHPYLFWEGKSATLNFEADQMTLTGFLIRTDTAVHFLENALASMGLNSVESTDFITYWGPRLVQKEYALIQFLVDDAYDAQVAGLQISPRPDAMRRLFMLFAGLDSPETGYEIHPQNLPGFIRQGLTLVEWGGAEIQDKKWLP